METTLVQSVIRRMRGGSQASLVQDQSGKYFVAKWMGNPQGNRTLINECIYAALAHSLGISTPKLTLLELPEHLRTSEAVQFIEGANRRSPLQGLHLGSECPVDPFQHALWDFLPEKLLSQVGNLADFGATFVLDRWTRQRDSRQAVYVRNKRQRNRSSRYQVFMIDHGFAFNGSTWNLDRVSERIVPGGQATQVYKYFDFGAVCRETVARIASIKKADIYAAARELPSCWFSNDDALSLLKLIDQLFDDQVNLETSVQKCAHVYSFALVNN